MLPLVSGTSNSAGVSDSTSRVINATLNLMVCKLYTSHKQPEAAGSTTGCKTHTTHTPYPIQLDSDTTPRNPTGLLLTLLAEARLPLNSTREQRVAPEQRLDSAAKAPPRRMETPWSHLWRLRLGGFTRFHSSRVTQGPPQQLPLIVQ